MGTSISELRKTLWRYVARLCLFCDVFIYQYFTSFMLFRIVLCFYIVLLHCLLCICAVCLIVDDNQFTISDTTQFIDYYTNYLIFYIISIAYQDYYDYCYYDYVY